MGYERLQAKQHAEALADVSDSFVRSFCFKDDFPSVPIEILHMVSENNSGDLASRR